MNEETLFHEARQKPIGERTAFLEEACGGNNALRARVESLLLADDNPDSLLELNLPATSATSSLRDDTGKVIGPYKLLQQIGEGGMGTVYMAEQTEPVQRKVALKIIKLGMDSRQVIARFEAERQALALMDHPNIAKMLEAGATDTGQPYFVMELVKGISITNYCDQHKLSTEERLNLFISVCSAVQHAHQKGIIHRDLKPNNVLVADYDDRPVAKIIDFGVAKAVGQPLTERTMFTEFGQVLGTIEYMSPEQAKLNQLDIDTRTDIYSLGVLLYELLAGSTPFDKDRLRSAAFDEMLRIIREEEPVSPSTRLSTSLSLPSIAANRRLEPKKLTTLVRGDLDWIVMKSLEKDRNRRYETATGLAQDIGRYLADEQVQAAPPSKAYRLRKFARRNKGPVLASGLVAAALVLGVIGTAIGLIRADHAWRAEAERAEGERRAKETAEKRLAQVNNGMLILASIFEHLNPDEEQEGGKPLSALLGDRLNEASQQLEGDAVGNPLSVARLQIKLANAQGALGHPERALPLMVKARDTIAAERGPENPETLDAMEALAGAYDHNGQMEMAAPLREEALKIRKATLGPDDPSTINGMVNVAIVDWQSGKFDSAILLFEEALKWDKAHGGTENPDTLLVMGNLAGVYHDSGKHELALPLMEETLQLEKIQLGPAHVGTLSTMDNLAIEYQVVGKPELALPLLEDVYKLRQVKLGPDHPDTMNALVKLAIAYENNGKVELAGPLIREMLRLKKEKIAAVREAKPDSMELATALAQLGTDLLQLNPAELAVLEFNGEQALQEAEPVLQECLSIRESKEPDSWVKFNAKSLLGGALLGQKKFAEAELLLLAGYEGMKRRAGTVPAAAGKVRLMEALQRIVQLYEATNQPEKAALWKAKLTESDHIESETQLASPKG